MPKRDRYPAGVPCWIDSARPDAAGGRRVLQRPARLGDGGPDAARRPRRRTSRRTSTAGSWPRSARWDNGLPDARWTTYIAVDDADDAAERVRAAGGTRDRASRTTCSTRAGWRCAPTPKARRSPSGRPTRTSAPRSSTRPGSWNWSRPQHRRPRGRAALLRRGLRLGVRRRWTSAAGRSVTVRRARATATTSSRSTRACASATREGGAPPRLHRHRRLVRADGQGGPALAPHVHRRRRRRERRARPELGGEVLVEPFDVPW